MGIICITQDTFKYFPLRRHFPYNSKEIKIRHAFRVVSRPPDAGYFKRCSMMYNIEIMSMTKIDCISQLTRVDMFAWQCTWYPD